MLASFFESNMNIIATINHLANNSKYMARLLGECYD